MRASYEWLYYIELTPTYLTLTTVLSYTAASRPLSSGAYPRNTLEKAGDIDRSKEDSIVCPNMHAVGQPAPYSFIDVGGGGVGVYTPWLAWGLGEGGLHTGVLCPKRLAAPTASSFPSPAALRPKAPASPPSSSTGGGGGRRSAAAAHG